MKAQAVPDVGVRLQRYIALRPVISYGWLARLIVAARLPHKVILVPANQRLFK